MIQKQGIDISFAQGLDTKTDPKRVDIGKFAILENTVFNKGGLLQKRNGYARLAALPDASYAYLATLRGNLTAIGPTIAAYNESNATWISRGTIQPLQLDTLPLIRNNLNQTQADTAISTNGLICTVYTETDGTTTTIKYAIANSITGQNIVAPTSIPVASGTVTGSARVYVMNTNFVIIFTNVITAVSHLQYIRISVNNPTVVSSEVDIASAYISNPHLSWDAYATSSGIFIAYNTTSGGQSIKVTKLTTSFAVVAPVTFAGEICTIMSVTVDQTASPIMWASYFDAVGGTLRTLAVDASLNTVLVPTAVTSTLDALNVTSVAANGRVAIAYEVNNAYSYDAAIKTNYIASKTVLQAGTVSAQTIIIRGIGLASKAFIANGGVYFLGAYQSTYQPSYFLISGNSTAAMPIVVAKLAYSNGGGYLPLGLPNVTVTDNVAQFPYLIKDLIQAVNKGTALATGTQTAGVYSQTGINLATITLGTDRLDTAEIASNLHISGGFLWMYDGYLPVEQNFFLWPDSVEATWSATGGSMAANPGGVVTQPAYYYQVTYEWTDNAGNAFRSAPSIPIPVTTTGALLTGSVTLNIPTLRLTYKIASPVKIVIYRWSVAQQAYYQTTSITAPLLNSTTVDSVQYVDTHSDATIIGNNLIYTTGGVVENINGPATNIMTLFDDRLWLVDSEDKNLLWFSKTVIEATPVEMSDLFTKYISPTAAAQGPTGPITALGVMDDKLIICKRNALYYINGTGPDNTGSNNQYSQPTFITATIGCTNQASIVFIPQGLMFQSDKGIWLLNRNLDTSYIGAPVEDFNSGLVKSAQNIPGTNQVRFILDTDVTLVYDYYYGQWSTFTNVPAISSCIFEELHTFINESGLAYQESPGSYVDGSIPVLIKFRTGPIRIGALQGYQRAFFFYLLGEYISPHQLYVSILYDYATTPSDSVVIAPINYSTPFGSGGSQSPYGQGNPYGGPSSQENWRVFLSKQRCQAFAIEVSELYDATQGENPGAGLTLSGINAVCGFKSPFRPQAAQLSAGTT